MDHLPAISSPAYPDLTVPLLCEVSPVSTYRPLFAYYQKHGYGSITAFAAEPSLAAKNSFLQSWLFFGLITNVFCEVLDPSDIDPNDFVTTDIATGRKHLTTAALTKYANLWKERESNRPRAERETHRANIEKTMGIAKQIYRLASQKPNALDPTVSLPIAVAAEALGFIRNKVYIDLRDITGPGDVSADAATGWGFGIHPSVEEKLKTQNWCPKDVAALEILHVSDQYFASRLSKPAMSADHGNCSKRACSLEIIDEATYETVHARSDCRCSFVDVPAGAAEGILAGGVVDTDNYVAISHVWSHGLGNTRGNSLPRCQLVALKNYAEALGVSAVWIDTLRVPRERVYRDIAIRALRNTYQNATKVLVLDRELSNTPLPPDASGAEIRLRVYTSAWMHRLWTLHEGVLAPNLHVQFQNGAVDFWALADAPLATGDWCMTSVEHGLPNLDMLRPDVGRPRGLDVLYISAIRERATTKERDEAICIAGLLGLPVDDLLTGSPEYRMMKLFSMVSEVNKGLIFHLGPSIRYDGFKWAPRSFFAVNFESHARDMAAVDGRSLRARSPAIKMDPLVVFHDNQFVIHEPLPDGGVRRYKVTHWRKMIDHLEHYRDVLSRVSVDDDDVLVPMANPALTMPEGSPMSTLLPGFPGVLVDIEREENGVMFAHVRAQVLFEKVAGEQEDNSKSGHTRRKACDMIESSGAVVNGRMPHQTQEWCLY